MFIVAILQITPIKQNCPSSGKEHCEIKTIYSKIPDSKTHTFHYEGNQVAQFSCNGEIKTTTPCMVGFYQDDTEWFDIYDICVALKDLGPTIQENSVILDTFSGKIIVSDNTLEFVEYDEMPLFFIRQRLNEFALRRRIINLRGIKIKDVFGYE